MVNILSFSGSSRKDSLNEKLVQVLDQIATEAGATVTHINLTDYPLPLYNGDDEAQTGLPANAIKLKALIKSHAGLVMGCPEYNGFMSPLLLNTIDWCTRSETASLDLSAFMDRVVLISGTSPGPGGAGRSVVHLRTLLAGIGSIVVPVPMTVPSGMSAFNEDGSLLSENQLRQARNLVVKMIRFCEKLGN